MTKTNKVVEYRVYEISEDAREFGRYLKSYKTKASARKFMEKSIYRYVKETWCLVFTLGD